MKYILKKIFPFFLLICQAVKCDESVLCAEDFCKGVTCPDLPPKCQIQNSTHNGIFLPSPSTCNCCKYCLENMSEGEACSTGNPANPPPTTICGPGLTCKVTKENSFDGFCERMNTPCTQKQDDYDNRRKEGTLGSMEVRQTCDSEGQFSSYKCIPGETCYCVDEDGNRIFGESDFTSLPEFKMQCKCSRDYKGAEKIIGKELNPTEHFRCASNGDYDTIQCFQGKCLCIDASDGSPSYPDADLVNITLISKETLPCYEGNTKGEYFRECEKEYLDVLNEVENFEKTGYSMVLSFVFPTCDFDGTYHAVQENSTHKICVDKNGNTLTAVNKKEDELATSMNCKCLRAISIMSTDEKPTCLENGNYSPIQCRRGTCRCVDDDGSQVCKSEECEVPEDQKNTLDCSK